MHSSFCLWLEDVEEGFWRMNRGVFRFAFHRLPEAIYRALVDTVGPATIRLIRVLAAFGLWLAVVFAPMAGAVKFRLSAWGALIAGAWLLLAIIGSMWGLSYIAKKRRAAAARAVTDACENGLPTETSRQEWVASA